MAAYDIISDPPKALTCDVFGTVVDWRITVTTTLIYSALSKTSSSSRSADLSPEVRLRLSTLTDSDWGKFAQEWRDSYKIFTSGFVPGESEWLDIDTHHHQSLIALLQKWDLEGLYTPDEIEALSQVWHYLDPWPDSSAGLESLGRMFITSTLSNGNQALLKDLDEQSKLGFKKLQSAEDFQAYKPHRSVYLGAAKAMGLEPKEVAMVAAHLSDLKAARECGFRTIYVERAQEEDWKVTSAEYQDAKGWVDMWVSSEDEGLLEVAQRFGLSGVSS